MPMEERKIKTSSMSILIWGSLFVAKIFLKCFFLPQNVQHIIHYTISLWNKDVLTKKDTTATNLSQTLIKNITYMY